MEVRAEDTTSLRVMMNCPGKIRARCMNEFRLFALGVEFDPDAYLASAPLEFDGVWRKGESGRNHPKSNGIFKVLGDGPTVPLPQQERIALEFLAGNRDALRALAQYPGVTTFILGLQHHIDLERRKNLVAFCVGPPAPLMRLALDIGLQPTYYITFELPEEF